MLSLKTKILEALVPGCALSKTIYDAVKAYTSSVDSFKQTLNLTLKENLVQSKYYTNPGTPHAFALYALREAGAIYLIQSQLKFRRDEIRTTLPAINMVKHELGVTEIVKAVRWEMIRIPYNCDYFDDAACKENKQHLELNGWIPDLFLKISNINRYYCGCEGAIEYDRGSRKIADVVKTVLGRNCQTLFICIKPERMLYLRSELARYDGLQSMVYFALFSDFCSRPGGVFSIDWTNLSGKRVGLYPKM